jgi:tRNA-dihydrouridine synthase
VARGCIGNPWIFRQARQLMAGQTPQQPSIGEQRRALLEHFDLSVALHGERRASQMMRKFGIKFSAHHPHAEAVKAEFIRCRSVAQWRSVIGQWYGEDESGAASAFSAGAGRAGPIAAAAQSAIAVE